MKKVCSSRNDIEGALSFLVTGEGRVTEKIPLSLLSKTIRYELYIDMYIMLY